MTITDFSDKKAVFFDIDGTLVDGATHSVPQSAAEAIRRLRANGHLAFINTGRTMNSIDGFIRDIGFDGYICACGARVYYNGEEIFIRTIDEEKCVEIIKKLREYKIPAFFESPEAVYFDPHNPANGEEIANSRLDFARTCATIRNFPKQPEGKGIYFDKFYCMFTPESDIEGIREYAKDDFQGIWHGRKHFEVSSKGCSKAEGIRILAEKLGFSIENCYAVGDSANDLDMLKAVPYSIAMGNSAKEIIPYCSYLTDSVSEDGILHALEYYGLI